ncbi:MAG: NAD-dependent epimerase/dehydratase family protein, partial [Candidatus Thorarchaeota archaeon]
MRVLLTGAFGNIGESTLLALFGKGYEIRCFDIHTERSEKVSRKLNKKGEFETIWGDILDVSLVDAIVHDIDCVIHLAGIIPPISELKPELAKSVNVEGTRNILRAMEQRGNASKLVFASSVSIFGPTMHLKPPRRVSDPLNPTDVYTHTKVLCENIIRNSNVHWTILRFAAAPPAELTTDMDPIAFEIPLDQRIEFVHTRDVGQACANAVEAESVGKTLLIGGGLSSQMLEREFVSKLFEGMGIGMIPDSAFRVATRPEEYFYTDWLDTQESQQLLQYQSKSFEDYIKEMKSQLGIMRYVARLFRGLA